MKTKLKNFVAKSVENACGSTHILLSFGKEGFDFLFDKAMQGIEWTEGKLVNKIEPEREFMDIVHERKNHTKMVKHDIKSEIVRVANDIKDMTSCDIYEEDDLINDNLTS